MRHLDNLILGVVLLVVIDVAHADTYRCLGSEVVTEPFTYDLSIEHDHIDVHITINDQLPTRRYFVVGKEQRTIFASNVRATPSGATSESVISVGTIVFDVKRKVLWDLNINYWPDRPGVVDKWGPFGKNAPVFFNGPFKCTER